MLSLKPRIDIVSSIGRKFSVEIHGILLKIWNQLFWNSYCRSGFLDFPSPGTQIFESQRCIGTENVEELFNKKDIKQLPDVYSYFRKFCYHLFRDNVSYNSFRMHWLLVSRVYRNIDFVIDDIWKMAIHRLSIVFQTQGCFSATSHVKAVAFRWYGS